MTTDFIKEIFDRFGWEDFSENDCMKTAINGGMSPQIATTLPMDGEHSELWATYIKSGLIKDGIDFEK